MAGHTPFSEIRQPPAAATAERIRSEQAAADELWTDSLGDLRRHLAGIGHPVDHLDDDALARLLERVIEDVDAARD